MFDAIDRTVEYLLANELNQHEEDIQIKIAFNAPNGEWSSEVGTAPTINLFFYDVRENPTLRRHQWQQGLEQRNGTGQAKLAIKRTPLMLDCFYLVTAWGGDKQKGSIQQHRLLGRALAALVRYPILNPPFKEQEKAVVFGDTARSDPSAGQIILAEQSANGHMVSESDAAKRAWLNDPHLNPLRDLGVEVRTRIAHHDVLTNPAEVWSALDNQMKAGFSYVVTLPLDPWRELSVYQVDEARWFFSDMRGEADRPLYAVGGVIRNQQNEPQANLTLRLLRGDAAGPFPPGPFEHGADRIQTTTDQQGRYQFAGLAAGQYTLLIQYQREEILRRTFAISADGPSGYDFII